MGQGGIGGNQRQERSAAGWRRWEGRRATGVTGVTGYLDWTFLNRQGDLHPHPAGSYCRMVVGSKAEDELLDMTREEVEKELLKMPAQKRFREFNNHLAKTRAEWVAMEKQLEKLET
jgi:hypothetical protein